MKTSDKVRELMRLHDGGWPFSLTPILAEVEALEAKLAETEETLQTLAKQEAAVQERTYALEARVEAERSITHRKDGIIAQQEARIEAYECLQKESAKAFAALEAENARLVQHDDARAHAFDKVHARIQTLEARCAAQVVRLDVVHTTRPLGVVIREATAPFEAKIQTLETERDQWKQKYQTELELCLQVHEDRDQWKADYYKTAAAHREYAHTMTEAVREAKIEAYEDCGRICEKHGIDSVSEIWDEIDERADALKAEGGK